MERRRQAVRPAVLGGSPRHFLLAERHLVRRRAQQGIIAQTGERAPLHSAAVARAAPSRGPRGVELAVPHLYGGFRERGAVGAPQAVDLGTHVLERPVAADDDPCRADAVAGTGQGKRLERFVRVPPG